MDEHPLSKFAPLRAAIAALYDATAALPHPKTIEACPCCMNEAEVAELLRLDRREASSDDLSAYSFNVLSTVGAEDDFRYYLPRILELAVAHEFCWPDPEIICGKLRDGAWRAWPPVEVAALEQFASAMFESFGAIEYGEFAFDGWVCGLGRFVVPIVPRLSPLLSENPAAMRNLITLTSTNSKSLAEGKLQNAFWEKTDANYAPLVEFLRSPEIEAAVLRAYETL